MARVCEVCGKSKKSGNRVTFSHRLIKRSWTPNLRRVRIYDENGTPKRAYVCTRCLRSGKVNRTRPDSGLVDSGDLFADVEEAEAQDVVVEATAEA